MSGLFERFRFKAEGADLEKDAPIPKLRCSPRRATTRQSPQKRGYSPDLDQDTIEEPKSVNDKSPSKIMRKRTSRGYADPSVYAHLPQTVADSIKPGLTLLIVGLNPGVMTAQTSLHFANPTNLFWPLLYSSGIITRPMKAAEGCSCLVKEFNVGITNIISRPTAEGGELAKSEYVAGAVKLEDKVRQYRPKAVSCSGKGIWDAVFRHIHGRPLRKSDKFEFGWQKETWAHCQDGYRCPIFVTMGTSGRVAAYSPEFKRQVFAELGDWVQSQRRTLKEPKLERLDSEIVIKPESFEVPAPDIDAVAVGEPHVTSEAPGAAVVSSLDV